MRAIVITLIFCLGLVGTSFCQKEEKKNVIYKTWVQLNSGKKIKGILYSTDEDKITVKKRDLEDDAGIYSFEIIDPLDVKLIKVRRKGKVGRGALFGGLATFGVAYIAGSADGGGWIAPEAGAAVVAPVGSLIGMAVSSKKETIDINSDIDLYREKLDLIRSYCEIKQ